jgi:hypothetical protein
VDQDIAVRRSRRAVLGAALGGAAAVAATAVAKPLSVSAADGGNVILGQANTSSTATSLQNTTAGGTSVVGTSATGIGLQGLSTDTTPTADFLTPSNKTGVYGVAGSATNATENTDETGVYGFAELSSLSAGVWGESSVGTGVFGYGGTGVAGIGEWGVYGSGMVGVVGDVGTTGTGVYGWTGNGTPPTPGAGVGVYARAESTSQYALYVVGKARFSRSGRTSFGSTATSKKISMTGVTSSSYVIATMQTNVSGLYVRAVVCGTGYFYIYLSKAPGKTAYVGYMVIN